MNKVCYCRKDVHSLMNKGATEGIARWFYTVKLCMQPQKSGSN